MANHVLFVVHGMGRQTESGPEAWFIEIDTALRKAWKTFPTLSQIEMSDFIEVAPLSYDRVFRQYLSTMGSEAEGLKKAFPDSVVAPVFNALAGANDEEAGFFWDNVFDVFLYQLGDDRFREVHTVLLDQLVEKITAVRNRPGGHNARFSVLCHSLGTAVCHNALNRLGGGPIGASDVFTRAKGFGFHTYMSIANVSGVLWPEDSSIYQKTIVRPPLGGTDVGYVAQFLNARHIVDPFPVPKRFAPPQSWAAGYKEVTVRHLRDANVHGFTHYLQHPAVSGALFRSIMGTAAVPTHEIDAAVAAYRDIEIDDPAKLAQVEALVQQLAADLETTLGEGAVLPSVAELIPTLATTLIKHRRAIKPLLAAV